MTTEKYSILAIDDAELILDMIKLQLGAAGYSVTTASKADAAKNLIQLTKYDLILLDFEMPDISGVELLEFIKQRGDNTTTPVVMLTGHNDPEKIQTCISKGARDYILKPFNIESVKQRVKNIISENQA